MVLFWSPGVYLNNGPSPGHSNYVSEEVYICSSLLPMISWWLPYLAKGPTPYLNSGQGNDSNIGSILAIQHLFESNLNNSPSPSHSNLVSDGIYICSGLSKDCAGLTSIMAWEVTRIVTPFCPRRLFESDLNKGSFQAIPMLNCNKGLLTGP